MTPIFKACLLSLAWALLLAAACGRVAGLPGSSMAISDKPRDQSPSASPEDIAALAEGNAALAFDLYRSLRAGEGNLFFSPYSISVALAMTYAGAAGETADQMADTLHFTLPQNRLHPAFNAYSLDLEARAEADSEGTPFELSIANSLWGQEGFPFRDEFLDVLAENYGAGMRLVDFAADPEASRQAINEWVSDETRKKIQDLIPQGAIDAMTRLVLANAIYFKAAWLHAFEAEATSPEPFHLLDGSTVDVPMMHQEESFSYSAGPGYQALELPYETGNMSMLIILPEEGQFPTVEQALNEGVLREIVEDLGSRPVVLTLPKFTYESAFALKDVLQELGMSDAFDPDRADFSGMDGARDLFIGSVLHKAFVSVDEEGTEAAAATAVIMQVTSAPIDEPVHFTVDRPFIFLIRDGQTGSLLFVGRVVDPSP
ncbi:MAG TPA: serpin family protein [Anaerolineales bacterium]|nr:serpin family protein [Anaerolineales bacterium]